MIAFAISGRISDSSFIEIIAVEKCEFSSFSKEIFETAEIALIIEESSFSGQSVVIFTVALFP